MIYSDGMQEIEEVSTWHHNSRVMIIMNVILLIIKHYRCFPTYGVVGGSFSISSFIYVEASHEMFSLPS